MFCTTTGCILLLHYTIYFHVVLEIDIEYPFEKKKLYKVRHNMKLEMNDFVV